MSLRDKIINNGLVNAFYKFKFYSEIAMNEISWISSKLPQLVSIGVIFWWFDLNIPKESAPIIIIVGLAFLNLFGYYWKKWGFFDTDRYISAKKDPIYNEMLEAARIIKYRFPISEKEKIKFKEEMVIKNERR